MLETFLVPEKTVVNAKGDGAAVDLSGASGQIFLLTLEISNIVEQEALEVSIFGSADGAAWGAKPIVSYPQKFYRGEYPFLLDLTAHTHPHDMLAEGTYIRNAEVPFHPAYEQIALARHQIQDAPGAYWQFTFLNQDGVRMEALDLLWVALAAAGILVLTDPGGHTLDGVGRNHPQ